MLDEHVGKVLFAYSKMESKGAVVVAGEEPHAGRFYGSDDEARRVGGVAYLPEGGGAGLLNLGVGREVFEW
jgi:hypothetical protein